MAESARGLLEAALVSAETHVSQLEKAIAALNPKTTVLGVDGLVSQVGLTRGKVFAEQLGTKWDRWQYEPAQVPMIEEAVAAGFKFVVLYKPANEATVTRVEAQPAIETIYALMERLGLELFEPFNEPYFMKVSAAQYAAIVGLSLELAKGRKIKVLQKYWGDYPDPTTGVWSQVEAGHGFYNDTTEALKAAGFAQVTDVAIHTYGPLAATGPFGGGVQSGWGSLTKTREWVAKTGLEPLTFYVTETGQEAAAENVEQEQRQAEAVAAYVKTAREAPDIAALFIYSLMYESQWGIYKTDGEPKLAAKAFAEAVKA